MKKELTTKPKNMLNNFKERIAQIPALAGTKSTIIERHGHIELAKFNFLGEMDGKELQQLCDLSDEFNMEPSIKRSGHGMRILFKAKTKNNE